MLPLPHGGCLFGSPDQTHLSSLCWGTPVETIVDHSTNVVLRRTPWNKGKLVGQMAPLKLKGIWASGVQLQIARHIRELAIFNRAIDSKLRS